MDLWHDVRYAVRRLMEARWFTLAAVTALSLGIGANTTVFTIVNAILLRGLPFPDGDRIMAVSTRGEQGQELGVSLPDLEDLRDQASTLEGLSGHLNSSVNLSDDEQVPERVQGAYVTANFFDIVGEQPVLGRGFRADDDVPGADPVILIGYATWQIRYAGDPDVLGRTVRANSLPATIVGVMAPNMRFPQNTELWIPQANLPAASDTGNRGARQFNVTGVLAPGATLAQTREEMAGIGTRLAEAYPETNADLGPYVESFQEDAAGGEIRVVMLALMGAVVFVLLIACANVANLLLARSAERAKEIAVRLSLGATRGRVVRQLLVESLLIAVIAGALGLVLALGGIRWFDTVTSGDAIGKPYWMVFSLDPVVFGYMAAVCLGTAVMFGLAPALHVSGTDVNEVLKEGTRGGSGGLRTRRWTATLIVAEVALTLVLLSGAGFMMRSFMSLYTLDLGIETAGLMTSQIYLPLTKYPDAPGQLAVYDDLLGRLEGESALQGSALTTALPLGGGNGLGVEMDGRAAEPGDTRPLVTRLSVSEGYFGVLGLELLQGRSFTRDDGLPGSEVAVVNQRFVDLHLPDGDALGRRVRLAPGGATVPADAPWVTVVGVVPNVRQGNLQDIETDPVAYVPLRQAANRQVVLLARSSQDEAAVTTALREAMRAAEPDLALDNTVTLESRLALERWPFRVFGTLFAVFAAIALTLSAVGLYSVTSHSVVQRVREFGIRSSLGAEPRAISWLALRRVLGYLAVGVPLGGVGAYGAGRVLESLLVQTSPSDPVTIGGVLVVMIAVAMLACLLPARRAARIDPMVALRTE
jgi:predicted permease